MNEKLDKKLAAYEKKRRITNDGELLDALERIIDRETRRPPRKMDTELIAECTKLALTLRGADPDELAKEGAEASRRAAREALEEYRGKHPEETSRTPSPRRLFILIPAIALLVAMMTFAVSSSSMGDHLLTKYDIMNREPGVWFEKGDSDVIIAKDAVLGIESLDDLAELIDDPNLLLPYALDSSYIITDIEFTDFAVFQSVSMIIRDTYGDSSIDIYIGEEFQTDVETIKIGKYDVHLTEYDGYYQAEFCSQHTYYRIKTYSPELRILLILSMRGHI